MKTKILIIFFALCFSVNSQSYLGLSVDNGYMINADVGFLKMGVGMSGTLIIPNDIPLGSGCNYATITASLISYPHSGEKYRISNINDNIENSFNYGKIMVGYRISIRLADSYGTYSYYRKYDRVEGLSFEPRIGTMISDNQTCIIFSPQFVYIWNGFQFALYGDYGQGKKHTNIGYNTTFAVGLSLGYNIKI